jgi:hypothetical protein
MSGAFVYTAPIFLCRPQAARIHPKEGCGGVLILGLREGCPEENGHNDEGDYHEHDRRKSPILPLPLVAEPRRGDRTVRCRARLGVNVNVQFEPNARHHAKTIVRRTAAA